jgi:hypothetical protein
MVKVIILLVFITLPTVVEGQWRHYPWQVIQTEDFHRYLKWIDGSFSSRQQSIEEPYFSHVVVYHYVFRYDDLGAWMYIQQGMFGEPPYRKRVYLINQITDSTIISRTFHLKSPNLYNMQDSFLLQGLLEITLDSLIYIKDCNTVTYMGADKNFYGKIEKKQCPGSYAEATHTTSEFRVYEDMIVSWERGWTGNTQRWGSSRGYYYFRRIR